MHIVNVGSINIDHVYGVEHFVRPGETLASDRYATFAGGKGFNQSVALARAGALVKHVGAVGRDGEWLLNRLRDDGVDVEHVRTRDAATGHAIIQVETSGENAILLHAGANALLSADDIDSALGSCSPGDHLLLQNETSAVADAMRAGKERGLRVVFNPAPMTASVLDYPLGLVDMFILNETEATGLTGETQLERISAELRRRYRSARAVLTLGSRGARYLDAERHYDQPAFEVETVDTTAAGDTFIGYFLADLVRGADPAQALLRGCAAASRCVTKPGASDAIPYAQELDALL